MNSSFSKLSKSSKSVEYQTPIDFYKKLDKIFSFRLDPATTPDNPLGTEKFYTKEQDGLDWEWDENTYCNPPFGKKDEKRGIDTWVGDWIKSMYEESLKYPSKKYVMLLPARTDNKWFQELIMNKYRGNSVIYFLKGRLKFISGKFNPKNNRHNLGMMLWIIGAEREQLAQLTETIPGILIDTWYIGPKSF